MQHETSKEEDLSIRLIKTPAIVKAVYDIQTNYIQCCYFD